MTLGHLSNIEFLSLSHSKRWLKVSITRLHYHITPWWFKSLQLIHAHILIVMHACYYTSNIPKFLAWTSMLHSIYWQCSLVFVLSFLIFSSLRCLFGWVWMWVRARVFILNMLECLIWVEQPKLQVAKLSSNILFSWNWEK